MDRNFHINDFERLLREKTDEFRMYPSKRTWHSIYNNIHPGRKWPSVAMCITLIGSLFLVGYLNTNTAGSYPGTSKASAPKMAAAKKPALASTKIIDFPRNVKATVNQATVEHKASANGTVGSAVKLLPSFLALTGVSVTLQPSANDKPREGITDQAARKLPLIPTTGLETAHAEWSHVDLIEEVMVTNSDGYLLPVKIIAEDLVIESPLTEGNNLRVKTLIPAANATAERSRLTLMGNNPVSPEDKAWMENYAMYNRPATKKWANKLARQTYFTPSVIYRELFTDPNFGRPVNAPPPLSLTALNDVNNAVIHKASYGFEIGTGVNYTVWTWLSLKAGVQLNYTRYNAEAFQNTHPVTTRITMHDYKTNSSYEETRATPYSNKSGLEQVNLHNETIQLSIPLGLDLRLLGNEALQWRIGATIQPTYIPAGKSYLISSDRRNYVKETSMINRWNLNAGFETFVSYKAPNGLRFDLGPQYRRQLFTTNNKQIAVEEKLYGIGLKFGISTTLK